jgi:hypothetical protein
MRLGIVRDVRLRLRVHRGIRCVGVMLALRLSRLLGVLLLLRLVGASERGRLSVGLSVTSVLRYLRRREC